MNKIVILTDSSCCLNSKLMADHGVAEIIPMHFIFRGKEYDADGDWKTFNAKEYYDAMRNGERIKSAQINDQEYAKLFKKYLELGNDILSISCTSALSASVKASYAARDQLKDQYPNQKIRCVDSANCCYSLAMLIKDASILRDQGLDIDEIVDWIEENKHNYNEIGTVEKLSYLRQAGRISASAAFFGGMLSVKPIVVYDMEGHNVAIEKVKGRKKSFEVIADYIKKYANLENHKTIYIAHGDALEEAHQLGDLIQAKFSEKLEFVYDYVEPGVASSVGPGTMIVGFYACKEMRLLSK